MTLTAIDAARRVASLAQFPTGVDAKAAIIAFAQAADPPVDPASFKLGDPSERFLEYTSAAMGQWGIIPTQAIVAPFLMLCTDPGDRDDFGTIDPADLADDRAGRPRREPRPGFLSALGAERFHTIRGEKTQSTSFVTIRNDGATSTSPFTAGQLDFEASTQVRADGGVPTFTSTEDPGIYVGIGSTLALAPGASVTIPVRCRQLGSYGSVPAGAIDTCITQSYGTLVVTASTTAVGNDRESRSDFIARCLTAEDSNAPGGPTNAYLRAVTTGRDGAKLRRFDGTGEVSIVDAYVSPSSPDSEVTVFVRGPAGAVDAIDVASATANVVGVVLGIIDKPTGVLPDCVIVGPTVADPYTGTAGVASCFNLIVPVSYSARIRARDVPGGANVGTYLSSGPNPDGVQSVFDAIAVTLSDYLLSTGIGGLNQTNGNGHLYKSDIAAEIRETNGRVVSGTALTTWSNVLFGVTIAAPTMDDTHVPLGYIPTAGTITGALIVVP